MQHRASVPLVEWGLALGVAVWIGLRDAARSAEAPSARTLSARAVRQLRETTNGHQEHALKLLYSRRYSGALDEALKEVQDKLALERKTWGNVNQGVADSLTLLALVQEARALRHSEPPRAEVAAARRARHEEMAVKTKLYGEANWRVTDARRALAHFERQLVLTYEERQLLEDASRFEYEADWQEHRANYREAVAAHRKSIDVGRRILRLESLDESFRLEQQDEINSALIAIEYMQGNLGRSDALLVKALEIRKTLLGEKHPDYAVALTNLARFHLFRGDYAEAEKLLQQALEIRREENKKTPPDYLQVVTSHGRLYSPLYAYARQLNSLGGFYCRTGDYTRAEPLIRQANDIFTKGVGKLAPAYVSGLIRMGELDDRRVDWIQADFDRHFFLSRAGILDMLGHWHADQGDYVQAEKHLIEAQHLRQMMKGQNHPDYAESLIDLGSLYTIKGEYERAEPLLRQAADIIGEKQGKAHPRYATCLNRVAVLLLAKGEYPQAGEHLRAAVRILEGACGKGDPAYGRSLVELGRWYATQGEYGEAEQHVTHGAAVIREVLGDEHAFYAESLYTLGGLRRVKSDYAEADKLIGQGIRVVDKKFGKKHRRYADGLHARAQLVLEQGDYSQAEEFESEALAIRAEVLGKAHPAYANSLDALGRIYCARGDYRRAEETIRHAMQIRQNQLGKAHPDYAASQHSLGHLFLWTGDLAQAELLLRPALESFRKLSAKGEWYLSVRNELGVLHQAHGDYDRAAAIVQETLEIWKQTLGEDNPRYALGLNNLGMLYLHVDALSRAEQVFGKALQVFKIKWGEHHPEYARALHNLASVYRARGELDRAEPLMIQASAIREQQLGKAHLHYAASLTDLGWLKYQQGDGSAAETLLREALQIHERHLELALTSQAERPQLATLRHLRRELDSYLSLTRQAGLTPAGVYAKVLLWKGTVFARQRRLRSEWPVMDAETAQRYENHRKVCGQLASLFLDVPESGEHENWKRRVRALNDRKEKLERELAQQSSLVRGEGTLEAPAPSKVQAALPPASALVDLLEYTYYRPPARGETKFKRERQVAAFVVRPEGAIVLVDLGPWEPIAVAIKEWRTDYADPARMEGLPAVAPATKLRRLLWEPLAKHLRGVQTVLVSADGILAGFPFAALPASDGVSFLIEELAIAVIPVPSLLATLREQPEDGTDKARSDDSLLLMGDVAFASPTKDVRLESETGTATVPARRRQLFEFRPLPETAREVEAVAVVFQKSHASGRVSRLCRGEATKGAFQTRAPGQRFIHLATHGFFAPAAIRSALAGDADAVVGLHPGLLTGLAMAGSNAGSDASVDSLAIAENGILTGLEAAALDLRNTELVVLSACETGLGQVAGGEGLLGLQRAFQVSGARTVVASLWKVDDAATRRLMIRFYQNLWQSKKPMTKLEALRQAQLWMLREGVDEGLARGVIEKPVDQKKFQQAQPEGKRALPFFWAGFVLSGDWR
jgi:CHAT domain-containing protein/tetratricopeptide (TPR) repeat protein